MKDFGTADCKHCNSNFNKTTSTSAYCSIKCRKAADNKKNQRYQGIRRRAREIARRTFKTPEPCEMCNRKATDRHHDDYNKPLQIRWLCEDCHKLWHKLYKPVPPTPQQLHIW